MNFTWWLSFNVCILGKRPSLSPLCPSFNMWKTPGSHVSSSWIYPVLNVQRLDVLTLRVPVCLGAIILLAIKNTENEKKQFIVSHYLHARLWVIWSLKHLLCTTPVTETIFLQHPVIHPVASCDLDIPCETTAPFQL